MASDNAKQPPGITPEELVPSENGFVLLFL
jgi:hypothetical protein